jgi:hypothetical protein
MYMASSVFVVFGGVFCDFERGFWDLMYFLGVSGFSGAYL